METKLEVKCARCGGELRPGMDIVKSEVVESDSQWQHADCDLMCRHCADYEAEDLILVDEDCDHHNLPCGVPTGCTPVTEVGWPEYLGDYDEGCPFDDPMLCPSAGREHWHVSSYCSADCLGWTTDIRHGMDQD